MADYINREDALKLCRDGKLLSSNAFEKLAIKYIADIPSADVQPVVHGEWKQTGGKYSRHKTIDRRVLTCSVCGNFLCMEGVNAGRGDANYCPNCGAKMDGGT